MVVYENKNNDNKNNDNKNNDSNNQKLYNVVNEVNSAKINLKCVMEYKGETLYNHSCKHKKNITYKYHVSLIIIRDIVKQLYHLRKHGYVHGDISPNNILYDSETQTATLIDFGSSAPIYTQNNNIYKTIQTYPYAPPEFFHENRIFSNKYISNQNREVWVLGIVVFYYLFNSYATHHTNICNLINEKDNDILYSGMKLLYEDLDFLGAKINNKLDYYEKKYIFKMEEQRNIQKNVHILLKNMLNVNLDNRVEISKIMTFFHEDTKKVKIQIPPTINNNLFLENQPFITATLRSKCVLRLYNLLANDDKLSLFEYVVQLMDNNLNVVEIESTEDYFKYIYTCYYIIFELFVFFDNFPYKCDINMMYKIISVNYDKIIDLSQIVYLGTNMKKIFYIKNLYQQYTFASSPYYIKVDMFEKILQKNNIS